jgi:rubrerythrin
MSDTPLEYFSDPRKKALDHLRYECFALEQEAKQYGWPEIQHALFRIRATEMAHAETFLRGQIRREVEARETKETP